MEYDPTTSHGTTTSTTAPYIPQTYAYFDIQMPEMSDVLYPGSHSIEDAPEDQQLGELVGVAGGSLMDQTFLTAFPAALQHTGSMDSMMGPPLETCFSQSPTISTRSDSVAPSANTFSEMATWHEQTRIEVSAVCSHTSVLLADHFL